MLCFLGFTPEAQAGNGDPGDGTPLKIHVGFKQTFLDNMLSRVVMPVDTPPPTSNPNTGPGDITTREDGGPFTLPNPENIETSFELNDEGTGFTIYERVGGVDIRPPSFMTVEEFMKWRRENSVSDYWRERGQGSSNLQGGGINPRFVVDNAAFRDIFGGGTVEIRPNGTALLDLGVEINRMENPSLPIRQQRTTNFRFDQQIQLNVVGKIGEKLRLNANWDTQATFDFENQLKLEYKGTEDEILQSIEAGNVALPLQGSLIQGGQSLFGIKTALKFGPVLMTTIASQQKGKTQTVTATGGAQKTEFSKKGNEYDEYRHFFLSHYFRNRYEFALENLPNVNSPITITRVEAWITNNNSSSTTENRNAVGFIDMGESSQVPPGERPEHVGNLFNTSLADAPQYPSNGANSLYQSLASDAVYQEKSTIEDALVNNLTFENGVDFQKVENMRKLRGNEFSYHPQLGYVSLNSQLQANQVLFVAYEYMVGGNVYQVGDFSVDPGKAPNQLNSNVLWLKMLKPGSVMPEYDGETFPTWDLMMKNIYNIGGYGLREDNFRLNITFDSRTSAGTIGYLPKGPVKDVPLLQVFSLDRLSNNDENRPDNIFDYKQNITIIPDRGLVIFPVLEPFGDHLRDKLDGDDDAIQEYVFDDLYSKTRADATNYAPEKDRFFLEGSYQGSSSAEISLNSINVAPNSVQVTANGITLVEGVDYQVDYNIGKVTILNQGILTSGQELKVTFETNSLFGIDTKTLVGSRFDIDVSRDIQLGATILHLNERPLTNKINIGDEPVSNVIWGLDGVVRKESRFLTKLVDKLPLLQTKEISSLTSQFEFAQLIPGHPRAIQVRGEEDGIGYLDDFESAKTTFDLMGVRNWTLASFPGDNGNNNMYEPQGGWNPALNSGFSRGRLAWYSIDPSFYFQSNSEDFPADDLNRHYTRQVKPQEVFPQQTLLTGDNLQRTFDLHYIPDERGPYNYETDVSKIDAEGKFLNPTENWAGIMRRTSGNTDFEAANFEFIEFWMMDPFIDQDIGEINNNTGGEFFLNLGLVSEDVIPDGNRNFENGLPTNADDFGKVDTTEWGYYPVTTPPTIAFNNDQDSRDFQDVGLDGLRNEDEVAFFDTTYLALMAQNFPGQVAYQNALADPSSDRYDYFRGDQWDGLGVLERYKNFNGHDGNTPINATQDGFSTQGSPNPDTEDINLNGTLNTSEQYYEYKLNLRPNQMEIGKNFIVDVISEPVPLNNGTEETVNWYQFRVPLVAGTPINNIQNFKAIEFVRLYMKDWEQEAVLRMARFQLVSTSWRTYRDYLGVESDTTIIDPAGAGTFELGTVNIEENGERFPFNYVLPPNIVRQNQVGAPQQGLLQNEQSLVLKSCNLPDGDARGAFKLVNFDIRSYTKLKMWVHAENVPGSGQDFQPGELRAFIRMGSDHTQNYYEYEIPLTASTPGVQDTNNIWLAQNQFDFEMAILNTVKGIRNQQSFPVQNRFEYTDSTTGNKVFVRGTPKFSEIKTLMVGIRNANDGMGPICGEVWFNELRVTDFDERSGYAANGRMNLKLADFADLTFSGSIRTPGFGALDQKINNRSRELVKQYDMAGNFNLGKFFRNTGIQLPLYVTMGERFVDPQFNPLESDVLLENYLSTLENPQDADSVKTALQDYTRNRSFSLNNIRKVRVNKTPEKGGKQRKPKPWDIENLSLSVSYNENFHRDHVTLRRLNTNHRASMSYAFNIQPKLIEPFKKAKKKNLITAFNFYPLPKSFSFNIAGDRRYEETWLRPNEQGQSIDPTFYKNFTINRNYSLRWDFTKSLAFNFTASNLSRVDEPFGAIKPTTDPDSLWYNNMFHWGKVRTNPDSILPSGRFLTDSLGYYLPGRDHLINIGRNTQYSHSWGLNYIVPFDKFKVTNWINSTVSYQGSFGWRTAPDNNRDLGNTINNSNTLQANARLNLKTLYQKVPFLRKIMEDLPKPGEEKNKPKRPGTDRERPPKPGEEAPPEDGEKKEGEEDEDDEDNFYFLKRIGQELGRIVLSIQNVDLTYSKNGNTSMAGYMGQTDNFGFDFDYQPIIREQGFEGASVLPPTPSFVMGWQNWQPDAGTDWLREVAARNGLISTNPNLATPFTQTWSEQFTGRTSVTLFKDFKIDLNITRNQSENYSELFRYDTTLFNLPFEDRYVHDNQLLNGQYSVSWIFLGTAFEKNVAESDAFTEFESNARRIISQRLSLANPYTNTLPNDTIVNGYFPGYYQSSQDVVLPSFLSAYGVGKSENIGLNPFPAIPMPNWNFNYNGLSRLEAFKDVFNSFSVRHAYRATYNVAGYTSNVRFVDLAENEGVDFGDQYRAVGLEDPNNQFSDSLYNFTSQYVIPTVGFNESFSPLIGVNMNFKNGIQASVDFKKSRQMSLSVGNLQLTETRSNDISISISWRKEKLDKQFRLFGRDLDLQNSLQSRLEVSLRDSKTRNRMLDSEVNPDFTGGNFMLIIKPSIDYVVNTKLNLRFYVEHTRNRPAISTSFPSSYTAVGFQVRFTLTN